MLLHFWSLGRALLATTLIASYVLSLRGNAAAGVLEIVPGGTATPPVPIYLVAPRGSGPFPAVLIMHGCDGFTGIDAVAADRLAPLGFVAVALDALGATHAHGACGETTRTAGASEVVDARSVLAWLRTQPFVDANRLALIGFSMGGDALLDLVDPPHANAPEGVRAAIAFYPGCDKRPTNVRVPLRIFDGDADRLTPAAPCASLVAAAQAAGQDAAITTYPGATHAFNVPAPDRTFFGEPLRFDPDATADAAHRSAAFLEHELQPASAK